MICHDSVLCSYFDCLPRLDSKHLVKRNMYYPRRKKKSHSESSGQISGSPEIRISGIPKIRKSGIPEIRNSGFPEIRISGNPDIRSGFFFLPSGASENLIKIDSVAPDGRKKATRSQAARFPDFRKSENPEIRKFRNSGNPELQISGIPEIRISGNPGIPEIRSGSFFFSREPQKT